MNDQSNIHKGLVGVIADESAVSKVNVEESQLYYRGYNVNDLCLKKRFIEVAYLLLFKELPTIKQLAEFEKEERKQRSLPKEMRHFFKSLPKNTHPMDYLRTAVSYVSLFDKDNKPSNYSQTETIRKALFLFAKIPTLIAYGHRILQGLSIIEPDETLEYSQNFLSMMLGKKITDTISIKTFDASMILYAEHGFNASTFSARVTGSTLSCYYSAITSAIGTLKGSLHGGANEKVMEMLLELKNEAGTKEFLLNKLQKKEKIMGFGHRLYRSGDSRVPTMKRLGLDLADHLNKKKWHQMAQILEDTMIKEKNIYPNLDFPSAIAYYLLDIPIPLYTPIFVASRITGWSAHLLEQYSDNKLIRPGCVYTGPNKREVR